VRGEDIQLAAVGKLEIDLDRAAILGDDAAALASRWFDISDQDSLPRL